MPKHVGDTSLIFAYN